MMVLHAIDATARRAGLRAEPALTGARDRAEVERVLEQLGAGQVRVEEGAGPVRDLLDHIDRVEGDSVVYELRLPHRPESASVVAPYLATLLATGGERIREDALGLRLALYELCMNALDHGRPLRPGATLRLGLRLAPDRIEGWLRDECEAFDPGAACPVPIHEQYRRHARRGYGLRIVQRLLGNLVHRHDGSGNLIRFTKEL